MPGQVDRTADENILVELDVCPRKMQYSVGHLVFFAINIHSGQYV